jgi:Putative peptidoglycan binding domain
MADEIRDHCSRRVAARLALFMLGFFLMFFLSSLVTASADAATSPGYASCPQLKLKSTGTCVQQLQRQLDADGISPWLKVDGFFGKNTLEAVKNFQHKMGLTADGVVGPQTVRALDQPTEAAGITTPSSARLDSFGHSIRNFCDAIGRHTPPAVLVSGLVVVLLLLVAAFCRVKSFHITLRWRRIDVDFNRYPPQRIVDSHARVLHRYLDAQSANPGSLPPIDDHIREIEPGSW